MENKRYISLRLSIVIIIIVMLVASLTGGIFGFWAGVVGGNLNGDNFGRLGHWLGLKHSSDEVMKNQQVINVSEDSATIDAVKEVSPAVVSVVVTKDFSKIYGDQGSQFPFDNFFFDLPFDFSFPQMQPPQGKQEVGGGTGFVVDADKGLILTNKHVVEDEQAEYSVVLNNGDKYDAQVLARDTFNDLAILQIEANDLTQVELGDSDNLSIGETVIAIGNALGEYRNTVTRGVVSGIGRTITAGSSSGSERLEGIIQTDAAINPGNSGGPLINLLGQVIGINTAIDQQGQSVGFAIPINEAKQVVESVKQNGRIVRPYLGVRYVLLNDQIAKDNNLDVNYGALVLRGDKRTDLAVIPGSPADKAGIVENDIILEVAGQKIDDEHSLAQMIQGYKPGDKIELKVWHKGDTKDVNVTLDEYKG